MDELVSKAAILQEALPYIRRFRARTFVVKVGGATMVDPELKAGFARDVCLLRFVGIQVVVVHGGGPQIDRTLDQLGIRPEFAAGLRVTDDATMRVVEMVLSGDVNRDLVGRISQLGGRAVGLSGRDDGCILARRMGRIDDRDGAGELRRIDPGRVGRIERVDPRLLRDLIGDGYVPVLSSIAVDADGHPLNVNADTAAGRVSTALGAAKLVLLTDVDGVKDAAGRRVSSLRAAEAEDLIQTGVIRHGMIPKVRCALDAVRAGVEKVHIIDGRVRHALLLEIFTDEGVGTEVKLSPEE